MSSDATPAYRGYRLQALYALSRVLSSSPDEAAIFQPEGQEDLVVSSANGILSEVIQVKAYTNDLVLSDFSPDKPDSFFYRVNELLGVTPSLRVSIVTFGAVGPELRNALSGDTQVRRRVARKLGRYGYITEGEAEDSLSKIQLVPIQEGALTQQVYTAISDSLVGMEPGRAFELLNHWLYVCSESKCRITRYDLMSRLNDIGRFVNQRAAHHREWFTAVVPVEDHHVDEAQREELSESFYRGVSAQYEHILADLDIPRPAKLQEIASKFRTSRIVLAYGASGQGKTTLAYRYLHDYFPETWRFQIRAVENRQHALSIAAALAGQADAIGVPIAVYLDVAPKDSEWPELVRQLSAHYSIRILVTVREEDYQRATISGAEFDFETVALTFDRTEAERLYLSLTQRHIPSQFLSFEDAWRTFMGEGPLLEFIYLVTQGALLRERLSEQITRLRDMVREGALQATELELLRLASVASALEARLKVKPLVTHLGLPDPVRTLQLFEGEYLLRRSQDGTLLDGMHPIRSGVLSELLSDNVFSPWAESASTCLSFMYEPDVEAFLLYAFARHQSERDQLLLSLDSYHPTTWTVIAGVTRAMLWLGIQEYVTANSRLIEEAIESKGEGWAFLLDFDIADAVPGSADRALDLFSQLRPGQMSEFQAFRDRQTRKENVFERALGWLSNQTQVPSIPSSDVEWLAVGEVFFWIGRWGIASPLVEYVTEEVLDDAVSTLPLHILADLVLGLENGYGPKFDDWLTRNRAELLARFRKDTFTVALEDDGQKLGIHFIIDPIQEEEASKKALYPPIAHSKSDDLHNLVVQRISLLSRLVPDRTLYGSQGYGHRLWSQELVADLHDSTYKAGILKEAFPPQWLTSVNATFHGLAEQPRRPGTWEEHAQRVVALRRHVADTLKQLQRALEAYFRKQKMLNEQFLGSKGESLLSADVWHECRRDLNTPILLPRCAVDEWGIVTETTSFADNVDEVVRSASPGAMVARKGLLIKEYRPYLEAFTKYVTALEKFMAQGFDVIRLNPVLGKGLSIPANRDKVLQQSEKEGIHPNISSLSMINLNEAMESLHDLQKEFRLLLGRFFTEAELDTLDKQEASLFGHVWNLWYFLAFQPNRVTPSATQVFNGQVADTLKNLRRSVERKLKEVLSEQEGVTFSVVRESIKWDGEPTLCILIDGTEALSVYKARDHVLEAVRQALPRSEGNELRHYVQAFHWHYLTVIPLVRGRLLAPTAWHIFLLVLQSDESAGGLKWWNYALKQIPTGTLKQLGLRSWELPALEVAATLDARTVELYSLVGHLRDLLSLPELDELGTEMAQNHIAAISEKVSEALQAAVEAIIGLLRVLKDAEQRGRERYPNLELLQDGLSELFDDLLPTSDYEPGDTVSMANIPEWATRLEKVREYSTGLFLLWATDILAQAHP